MVIGKIVKSDSHVNYVCQIFGAQEAEMPPSPADYAFGRFVRVAQHTPTLDGDAELDRMLGLAQAPVTYAIGVIYDTILQNPAFGTLGPRLSNELQVELFSPDYIAEKAILIYILVLGTITVQPGMDGKDNKGTIIASSHGVPPLSLELDSKIETMSDEEVRAFHYFSDAGAAEQSPYLHMGYLPHIIAQRGSLLPIVTLQIIEQLESLFPQDLALISIVKRNFSWRLKVETTG
jgi:hypothetical protein